MRWSFPVLILALAATGSALAAEPKQADQDTTAVTEAEKDAAVETEAEKDATVEAEAGPVADEKDEEKAAASPASQGPKMVSGMSILGNQEAPKSLVIVPWKSSEIGDSLGLSTMLDDSRQPIDREVFLRELNYYEIRSGKKP